MQYAGVSRIDRTLQQLRVVAFAQHLERSALRGRQVEPLKSGTLVAAPVSHKRPNHAAGLAHWVGFRFDPFAHAGTFGLRRDVEA